MHPVTHADSTGGHRIAAIARRLGPALVVLGLVAAGWSGWHRWRGGAAPTSYTTTALSRTRVVQTVTASGTLSPVIRSTVGSQVSGRITEILVDFNDRVTKGQVLARLDRQLLAGQVAQAKARLTSARAELSRSTATADNARQAFQRTASMVDAGVVSAADVDAARAATLSADAAIQSARASIVEAQAALDNATTNLAYTTITAPIDGVVIARSVDAGQTVAASLQAPELFVIAGDLSRMELHAAVAEADVGQLADAMKVELAFDAYPDRTFPGVVRQIRNQATTTQSVVTYDAVVAVDNHDGALRPGMTATATFIVAEVADTLAVPAKALRYRPAGAGATSRPTGRAPSAGPGRPPVAGAAPAGPPASGARQPRGPSVWVLRDGVPVRVAVELGLSDGATTAVTSAELHDGDLVITTDSAQRSPAAGATRGAGREGGGPPGPPPLF